MIDLRHRRKVSIALPLAGLTWLAGLLCVQQIAGAQNAPESELREFEIFVKDKPAGKSTMRITDFGDGTTRIDTDVAIKLNFIVFVYRYEFHGQETWRGNQLLATANRATDDGKEYDARAQRRVGGFRIDANGGSHNASLIDMTTNYWRPPEPASAATLTLMNADRGTIQTAKVGRLAPEVLTFSGQQVTCSHYRLSGEVQAELWFDGQNRIVRQKTVEDGYPAEVRLTRVRREVPHTASRPAAPPRR